MEKYPMGAVKNYKDLRRINIKEVQKAVPYPAKYITDISFIPVMDQKQLGACVGHAHAVVHIYQEYKETGKIRKMSPRYLYALAKKLDGMAGEGTYPVVVAKISTKSGCATEETVPNNTALSHADYINITETDAIKEDAYPFRAGGYVDVTGGVEGLKQAIFQNGVVPITISVGNFNNPIKKGSLGLHRVAAYGYDGNKIYFRNSWTAQWGDNGNGYFNYKDQQVSDVEAIIDIPDEVLKKAQAKPTVTIVRQASGAKQTLGDLTATHDGLTFSCKTLELPDLANKKNVSCISKGTYVCKQIATTKYGVVYNVQAVPNRSGIYIHAGNYYTDILGCILLGNAYSDINKDGVLDVINSKITIAALSKFFSNQPFTLIIK